VLEVLSCFLFAKKKLSKIDQLFKFAFPIEVLFDLYHSAFEKAAFGKY